MYAYSLHKGYCGIREAYRGLLYCWLIFNVPDLSSLVRIYDELYLAIYTMEMQLNSSSIAKTHFCPEHKRKLQNSNNVFLKFSVNLQNYSFVEIYLNSRAWLSPPLAFMIVLYLSSITGRVFLHMS